MTSLPISFTVGSASSGRSSMRDALESYRRAQYLQTDYTIPTPTDLPPSPIDDEEVGTETIPEQASQHSGWESEPESDDDLTPMPRDDSIGAFQWSDVDGGLYDRPATQRNENSYYTLARPSLSLAPTPTTPKAREGTPLLRKTISFSDAPHPRLMNSPPPVVTTAPTEQAPLAPPRPILKRPTSSGSVRSVKYNYGGKSTFGQTLFNSIAILLGIGMLSEPLAFAYAGWFVGTLLIVSYGFIACYTAKILARMILSDPRLRTYADIGRKAFGPRSTIVISIMFCLELFAVSVILVTLYADSLHSIIPHYSADTYKIWGLLILIPTVFLPLSLLSYTSILGISSTLLIIAVILIDGFSKREGPGSLWSPAETSVGVQDWTKLGVAFGLFMAGFSGHAVIPSLARDMADPSQFDLMIDWAFVVATVVYTLIGYAGYLMFGVDVSDEISLDLLRTPGYNHLLNQAALWMLVISPLSKFALTTQPLNATIQILLGIDPSPAAAEEHSMKKAPMFSQKSRAMFKQTAGVIQKLIMTVLSVVVSVLVPEFSSAMAFLGSFSAFMLCIIGPVAAKVAIDRRCGVFDGFLLLMGSGMAIWGTMAAFWSA